MKRNKLFKTLAFTLALSSLEGIAPSGFLIKANANEWKLKDNSWHLLDAQGKEKTGWQQVDGKWYYLNDDGSLLASKWLMSRGKWYYLGSTGSMVTNNTVDNCELGSDGAWITNVGIDEELTEQLRNILVYHTSTYVGVKYNEFNDIMFQVADGSLSKEEAMENIKKMTWRDETNTIDYNYHGVGTVGINAVKIEKFNAGVGKTASQIAKEYRQYMRPSTFDNLVAYRNSDDSITITSIYCSLYVTGIQLP